MMTKDEVREQVKTDHAARLGRFIKVWSVDGYVGSSIDSATIYFDPPVLAMVEKAGEDDLFREMDGGWVDPVWNVELLGDNPKDVRSCWVYGTSYNYETGKVEPSSDWEDA